MRYLKIIAIALVVCFGAQSCSVAIFYRKKVEVVTDEGANIYVKGDLKGQTNTTLNLKEIGRYSIDVEIRKPGYKTRNEVLYPDEFNPGTAVGLILGAAAVGVTVATGVIVWLPMADGLLGLISPLRKNYAKSWSFPLTPLPNLEASPYQINYARIEVLEGAYDSTIASYDSPKQYAAGKEDYYDEIDYFDGYVESSSRRRMNQFLARIGVYDSTELRFGHYDHFTIFSTIESYTVQEVKMPTNNYWKTLQMNVRFRVMNQEGGQAANVVLSCQSGKYFRGAAIEYLFYDALEDGTIQLLENGILKEAMLSDNMVESDITTDAFEEALIQGTPVTDWSVGVASMWYLPTDYGNAVCIPVGEQGLLAVSHRGVDFGDSLLVTNPEGDELQATVLRAFPKQEFALIKVSTTFDRVIPVKMNNAGSIGQTVFALGYETYLDEIMLTKGVVNAERDHRGANLYQIDAECSSLFYPAVFNEDGYLVGFVTRSISSAAYSGISFYAPIK